MMDNTVILPYDVLNKEDWSVEFLIATPQSEKQEEGITLGELVELNPSKVTKNNKLDPEKIYSYIDSHSVYADKGIILEPKSLHGKELPARATLRVQEGDIILSTVRPERNNVAIIDKRLCGSIVNTTFVVIRPKKEISELLYFLLRSAIVKDRLNLLARGTAVPIIKLKDLETFRLPVADFNETQIATAKRLYELWFKKQLNYMTLQEITEGILQQKGLVTTSSNLELETFYKTIPYEQLKDSFDVGSYFQDNLEVREWTVSVKPLKDLANAFRSGAAVPVNEYQSAGIPYIRIKNMNGGTISLDDMVFISKEVVDSNSKSIVMEGNILISRVGTIGKIALIDQVLKGSLANQHTTIVEVNRDTLLPEFLTLYLSTNWAASELQSKAAGAAQQFIKLSDIKELQVPVPTIEEQQEFVRSIHIKIEEVRDDKLQKEIDTFVGMVFEGISQ